MSVVADERVRAGETGEEPHAQLGVSLAQRERRLLQQLRGALVGARRAPARVLVADRGRRQHLSVSQRARDLAPRSGRRPCASPELPAAKARGPELQVRLRAPRGILDTEVQRGREPLLCLVEIECRERCTARQQGVLDRARRTVDWRRGGEVMREFRQRSAVARTARPLQRFGHLEMQLSASNAGHPVVDGSTDELVGEPITKLAAAELLDHAVRGRLLERRPQLRAFKPGAVEHIELELGSRDSGQLQQRRGAGAESSEPLTDQLPNLLRASELGHRTRELPPVALARDRTGLEHGPPQLRHQEWVATRQPGQHPRHRGQLGAEIPTAAELDKLGHLLGAQASESKSDHTLRTPQVDQRRRQRLGNLGFGVAERGDHQRLRLRRAVREVAQEQQRRSVGPVSILDHQHERRTPARRRQQLRDRGVQAMTLGIRIGRERRGQLPREQRQIGEEP